MEDIIIKNSPIEGRGAFANRDFKKGEEITADYRADAATTLVYFDCHCKGKNCRGRVA